jgi:hypothetical protein
MNLQQIKSLNIEKWSTDNVCDWLKGEKVPFICLVIKFLSSIKFLKNFIFPELKEIQ